MRRRLAVAAVALVLSACPDWDESHYRFKCSAAFPQDCGDGGTPGADAGPGRSDGGGPFTLSFLDRTSVPAGVGTPVTATAAGLVCQPAPPELSLEVSGVRVSGPYQSTRCDPVSGTFTVPLQPGPLLPGDYDVRGINGDGTASENVLHLTLQGAPPPDGGADAGDAGGSDAGAGTDGGPGCGGPYMLYADGGSSPSIAISSSEAMVAFVYRGQLVLVPRSLDLSPNAFGLDFTGQAAVEAAVIALPSNPDPFAVAYVDDTASYTVHLRWVSANGTLDAPLPDSWARSGTVKHVSLAADLSGVGVAWSDAQTNGIAYAYDHFGLNGAWTLALTAPGVTAGYPTLAPMDSTGAFPIAIDGAASTVILDHIHPTTGAEAGGSPATFDGGSSSVASDGTNDALVYLAGSVLPSVATASGSDLSLSGFETSNVTPAIAGRPDGGFGFAIVYDGGIQFGVLDSAANPVGSLFPGPSTYDSPSTKLSVAWAGPHVLGWAADTDAGVMVGSICVP